MSTTKLGSCGCSELKSAEFIYTLDAEHPCVYDQVISTMNGLNQTLDYYLDSVLMFTVTITWVKIGTDFYIQGSKTIH